MNVLLLDGYNLIYRARYSHGLKGTEFSTIYNFFRSLKPIVEKFKADKIYFVLEGYPKFRYELCPEYKGTRTYHNKDNFLYQRKEIISLLKERFPIEVVRHEDYECDDVIFNLASMHDKAGDSCTIVSTDTDFYQIFNKLGAQARLYNPIKKILVEGPKYDYVTYKALRGDGSDNVIGFKGIGDKRASTMAQDPEKLLSYLGAQEQGMERFERNCKLIAFYDFGEEIENLERFPAIARWESVREKFNEMEFYSITNDKSWQKYINAFN